MTIYEKPNALVFAENAPSSEITDFTAWARGLGIAFDDTNGYPQMEGFNGLLNALSGYIKYLEQNGIPPWRDDLEYPVDARVVYNGIVYRCITQNTNAQPDLSQLSWANTVIDNLASASTQSSLSANQGRVLASMVLSTPNTQQIGSNILQWGRKRGFYIGNDKIKYNKPFPNNVFFVIAVNSSDGNNSSNSVISYPSNNQEFIVSIRASYNAKPEDSTDVTWFAIGN